MTKWVAMSIVVPVEIEADSVEEAKKVYAQFTHFLAKHPRILMAKGNWKIKRRDMK